MSEDTKKLEQPVTDEIATAKKDIDIFAGWLGRLENPDPVLRTEAGGKGLKLYDEVDRDAHAGSVLQTRYLSVVGKEYEVLPGEDTPVGKEIAEFVMSALQGTNFGQACQEILQAVLYGFFVLEAIWQVKDGGVVPGKLRAKHPRRFSFTVDRDLRLITPENMIEGEPVPDRKFIVFTFGSSDNPYGKGLGQKLWWPVWFKKNGIKFWLVFLDKFSMPTPVGKYPPGTKKPLRDDLLDAIEAIQTETGVTIPENMAIELLEAARTGTASYKDVCDYMDKQISKAVLGQTATTEGTPGKLGNDKAQEDVRDDILKADSDLLCECLNETLIKWIVDFNFPGVTAYPKLWIRTEDEGDLKPLAERDSILVNKIGLPVGQKYFYETYAVPEPESGEALVVPGAGQTPAVDLGRERVEMAQNRFTGRKRGDDTRPTFKTSPGVNFGALEDNPAQDPTPVNLMTDHMVEETADAWKAVLDHVRDLAGQAPDMSALRDAILGCYADLPSGELSKVMAAGFAAADLAGRYDLVQETGDRKTETGNE